MATEQSASVWHLDAKPRHRHRIVRFPGAIIVSTLAHGALLGLALWTVSDNVLHMPAGSSGGEAGSVTVTLIGPPEVSDGQGQQAPPRTTSELDSMFQKFQSNDSRSAPARDSGPKGGAEQLFQEIADSQKRATGPSVTADSSANRGDSDGDDLWGRIRPCWRRVSAIIVTLDVGLDSEGRLAGPPRAIRTSKSPPTPQELYAESMAVQAAVRCGPYHDAAPVVGTKTVRVVFSG